MAAIVRTGGQFVANANAVEYARRRVAATQRSCGCAANPAWRLDQY